MFCPAATVVFWGSNPACECECGTGLFAGWTGGTTGEPSVAFRIHAASTCLGGIEIRQGRGFWYMMSEFIHKLYVLHCIVYIWCMVFLCGFLHFLWSLSHMISWRGVMRQFKWPHEDSSIFAFFCWGKSLKGLGSMQSCFQNPENKAMSIKLTSKTNSDCWSEVFWSGFWPFDMIFAKVSFPSKGPFPTEKVAGSRAHSESSF